MLTDAYVRTAAASSGRFEVADLRCVGLAFRVTQSGVKSWTLRFRDPRTGRSTRATLGNYPEVSLQAARDCERSEIPLIGVRRLFLPARVFAHISHREHLERPR